MSAREAPGTSIADPKMKELDGLQLLKQIRVIDQAVPVIIVAGSRRGAEGRRLRTVRTSRRARASIGEPERG